MSENKHYGRQILLSLFITVFILLVLLYVASRYLLPLYSINQEQIYDVLVKLFPLLIGLIMIEIGVLVARRRDEDFADEIDKLPPNAYDKPLYTLPGDDPLHRHTDEIVFSQSVADEYKPVDHALAPEDELVGTNPTIREVLQPTFPKVGQADDTASLEAVSYEEQEEGTKPATEEPIATVLQSAARDDEAEEEASTVSEASTLENERSYTEEPIQSFAQPAARAYEQPVAEDTIEIASSSSIPVHGHSRLVETYTNDFDSILSVELENAQEMDYDLTLVLVDVSKGPAEQIGNKMIMLSGELAYSFILENNRIAMVLPFYNAEEARSFTLSLLESCKKEFSGASLQIGFASRNGRVLDSSLLLHEAVTACMLEDDDEYDSDATNAEGTIESNPL